MVYNKTNRVHPAKCCAICKYGKHTTCALYECAIYPGAVCENFVEDDKKTKRKLKEVEDSNMNWSISAYRFDKKIPAFYFELGDIYPSLAKKLIERIESTGLDASTKMSFHPYQIIIEDGTGRSIEKVIGWDDYYKFRKKVIPYIFSLIETDLDELDKEESEN